MNSSDYQTRYAKKATPTRKPTVKSINHNVPSDIEGTEGYATANGLLNAIWLKPGAFPNVADCGTHLEGQSVDGQWYRLDLTKIDKPSKSQ